MSYYILGSQLANFSLPRPVITSISPPAYGQIGGSTPVTILGTGFLGSTKVTIGDVDAIIITINSDGTQITATTGAILTAGSVNVSVTAAGGTGTGNNLFTYIITPDPPRGLTASLVIQEYGIIQNDRYATINFTIGSGNIIGYEYSLDGTTYTSFAPSNFNNMSYTIYFPSVSTIYTIYVINRTSSGPSVPATTTIKSPNALVPGRVYVAAVHNAPTITSTTSASRTITINFNAGKTALGADTITNYLYSTDGGATYQSRSPASTSSPLTISTLSSDGTTLLSVGTQYTIMINTVVSAVSPSPRVQYAYWSAPAFVIVSA